MGMLVDLSESGEGFSARPRARAIYSDPHVQQDGVGLEGEVGVLLVRTQLGQLLAQAVDVLEDLALGRIAQVALQPGDRRQTLAAGHRRDPVPAVFLPSWNLLSATPRPMARHKNRGGCRVGPNPVLIASLLRSHRLPGPGSGRARLDRGRRTPKATRCSGPRFRPRRPRRRRHRPRRPHRCRRSRWSRLRRAETPALAAAGPEPDVACWNPVP